MQINEIAGITVAVILGVDALIHAYWLTGRTWPAADTRTLSQAVLNIDAPFTPRVLIPLVVVLGGGAALVLARADLPGQWLPGWLSLTGAIAVATGAFLRGCAGLVWAAGIGADRGSAFYRLNRVAYTPICFVLCVAAAMVATR